TSSRCAITPLAQCSMMTAGTDATADASGGKKSIPTASSGGSSRGPSPTSAGVNGLWLGKVTGSPGTRIAGSQSQRSSAVCARAAPAYPAGNRVSTASTVASTGGSQGDSAAGGVTMSERSVSSSARIVFRLADCNGSAVPDRRKPQGQRWYTPPSTQGRALGPN